MILGHILGFHWNEVPSGQKLYPVSLSISLTAWPIVVVAVELLSRVRLFATPWTIAHQASPPMEFPIYWSE